MLEKAPAPDNYCQTCGACCSHYRVSFYWGETTASSYGIVPEEMTTQLNSAYVAMKGTDSKPARCVALEGEIGKFVSCSIYDNRSSTCRNFQMSMENGVQNPDCERARLAHGLGKSNPPETEPLHIPDSIAI